MVGVGNKALIALGQVVHNGLVALLEGTLHVFRTLAGRLDWSMNDEPQRVPRQETNAFLARKDVEAAVYRHGHDGQPQLVGQLEGAAAELPHVAGEGAGSFGKDDKRNAVLQDFAPLLVGLVNGLRTALVNKDVTGTLACLSYEGNPSGAMSSNSEGNIKLSCYLLKTI